MPFPKQFLVGLVLIALTRPAFAQSAEEMKACIDRTGGVSTEMLKCGKAEIDKWDARLNAAYKTLMDRKHGSERTRFQNEQRAWLKHHLREVNRLAADPNNGSMAFIESQSFELGDLSARTLELEKRVQQHR
ncbi:MAG: lysozyme inhibitor LprI family protein [Rhizobiaceae bacterium]|jgi:uncharacterized protein YecT (DUF1311 family)